MNELLERRRKLQSILDEKNKLEKVRNVKIISKTIKRLTPYIISTALASTALYYMGFGKPFVRDELITRKSYVINYKTPEEKQIDEQFITKLFSDYFIKSDLILYTPFTLTDDGMYTRHKITYEVDNMDSLLMYEALKTDNYEFIIENINPVCDETEKVNMISSNYVNDYYVDAHITAIDVNDEVKHKEDFKTNVVVTCFDFLTGFWAGLIVNRHKKKTYNDEIMDIYDEYNAKLKDFFNKYRNTEYKVMGCYLENEIASLDEQIKGAKKL